MSNYNTIRDKFKSMFLNELLVDDGWSAFIDLLLRNIDVSFLQFCRTNGFPYELHISDYVERTADTPPSFVSEVFDVQYSGGVVTLTYPKSATSPRFDFGDVTIAFNKEPLLRLSVLEDGKWSDLYTYDEGSGLVTGQPIIELNASTSFRVEYLDTLEDGSVADLYSTLLYLPEQINPASIQYYKNYNLMLVNEDMAASSPQALFGAITQLLQGMRFYLVFNTSGGGGDRQKSFPTYVTLYDVVKNPAVDDVPAHISAITAARVPLDALRDKFGYGAQQAQILGYDKNVLVVLDNDKEETLIALQADPPQTVDADIMVSPSSVMLPQHTDYVKLSDPTIESTKVYKTEGGPGWTFEFSVVTTDQNAKETVVGHIYDGESTQDLTLSPGTTSAKIVFSDSRAGGSYTFWAKSVAPENSKYLDSETVTTVVEVPKQLFPPTLSLEPVVQDSFSIKATWTPVESATSYELYYKVQGGDFALQGTYQSDKTSVTFEVPDAGTYTVYVKALADGFPSVQSSEETVTLSEIQLDAPSISWKISSFPQTLLTISEVANASGYRYRISWEGGSSEWIDASAGEVPNAGELKIGTNTIEVYAVGGTVYGDSSVVKAQLSAEKLQTPQVQVSVDLEALTATVSWGAISNANTYSVQLDTASPVSTSEVSYIFDVEVGQHTVKVIAKAPNAFDSDPGTANFTVVSSEFTLSESSLEFPQRETSGVVGVEATGAYEGAWNIQGASEALRKAKANVLADIPEGTPESQVEILVTTNPPQGFTTDLSEVKQPTPDHKYLVAQLGDGYALLCSPESRIYETLYGITKNYDMLSLDKGRVISVDLYIEELRSNVQQIFGDRFDALLSALEALLKKYVPIGMGYSVNFVYPMIESKLRIKDNYLGVSDSIYINGKSGTSYVQFNNLKNTYQFTIDTNRATLGWSILNSQDEN